jgi:DNA repair protein RadC
MNKLDPSQHSLKDVYDAAYNNRMNEGLVTEEPKPEPENGQGFGGDVVDSIQYGLAQAGGGLAETGYQLTGIEALADARNASNNWGKSQLEEMSPEGRDAMTAQIFEESKPDANGETSLGLGEGATNWKTWALQLSSLAGQMVPQIALGGGFASLGAKVAGKVVMKTAAKKAMASGATKEASILAGKKAAEAAFASVRGGAGVVGYAAVGTAIAGGMIGNEVRDEVMEMTNEQLDQSNEYRKLYYQLSDMQPELDVDSLRDLTKRTLADRTATTVQKAPMLITSNLLMEAVGGKFLDDIFRGVGSGSRSINAGKQFAVQGSTEAAQGGIEKYASNAAIISEGVDPNRDAFDGVKGAAANEGILGGALGGVMGAARKGEPLPQHEPLPIDNAEELNNTAESEQQPQPEMTLDEAVEQIKAERSEYRGIDDDIAIAQKQGFDEEAVRLRAAKRNFEMAQDLMNEGDRDSAMRFRERGLKIYRDVMEPNSPDNHESSNLFPAEYVATGNLMPRENTGLAVANQKQGETIEAQRPADISQQLGSPAERLAHEDIIYAGRDTTEIDEAKAKTDSAFMAQHEPKPVSELDAEVKQADPVIPMLEHDNTIYAQQDTSERDAAKAKTEAAFTTQQGKEPGAFNYDEVQQDKDQAVNRLTEIIADIKKTNVQDVNIKGERGRKGRVKIGDNYQPVTFKLVDMDANPALKPTISRSENQFRDRNRAASDTQIASIAAKLDFNELGESPRMTSGAPTLSREGRIIGGNGRMAAIRKAYSGKAAGSYKAELKKRAKEFGINPASIDKMKSPVLIRQFDNPVDIAKTAIESNNSGTMDMSALEQAAADNTLLPNVPDLEMDDAGNINWNNEGNRRSIRGFISALPQSSQNSLLKGDGTISPAGIRRFENLLTYKAFGQNQVLDNLIENAKEESSQNIKNVLQSLAPHIAMVRQGMKRGDYHHIDITDHLVEAIELLESLRASSRSVSDYMAQLDMVSVTDPVTNAIAQELEENVRAPKALRQQIKGYYDAIVAAGHPDQSDMFGTKSVSLTDLVGLNNDEANTLERDAGQDGPSIERAPAPQEAQPSNDSGRAETEPTASEPNTSSEEELLTSYTEEDIEALEAKNKAASDAKVKAEQQADQKAKADIEANDFKLSGSDRTADVAAAEGQNSLFDTATKVDQAASEAATSKNNNTPEPTEAQQEAGNYKKGHVTIQGLDIAIENERGSERKGTDPDGNEWAVNMAHHYGYIKKTEGADGDHVDVFIGKNPDSEKVFIVDQVNPDGTFDEHKIMLGFNNKAMAVTGYKSSYQKGWKVGPIKSMTMAEFKDWLKSGDTKKPFGTVIDDGTKNVVEPENTNETTQKDSTESTNDQEQKPATTAIKDEKQPKSKEPIKKKTAEKLDDAGEVLWGARKHITAAYEKSFSDEDIESLPLSKIWPKKDIDDIDNHYIAALATVAREQIPSKPRKSYRLSRWVASVQMYRGLISDVVKNPKLDVLNKSLSDAAGKSQQSANFFNKMQLLSKLDRKDWPRIGSVAINANAQVARDGGYVDQPFALIETDGVRKIFHDVVDVPSLLPKVKELLNKDVKTKTKKMAFEIRGRAGNFFINKKGDKAYRKLIEFDDLKEARDFKNNQNEKLVELWEAVKAQENVNKADVRPKEALPRTGKDHREGKDITAEEFKDAFGFRGVQFGNWVKQGSGKNDRQGFVNQAYDAFMDLSEIIGVPPMALSLNGDLGIAFGARGKSKAMAHFEPNTNVINLTKMSGAGTLAHEWFHALDNYFHKQRGEFSNDLEPFLTYAPESHYTDGTHRIRADVYESESFKKSNKNLNWEKAKTGLRNEIADAFTNLVKVLQASNMQQRARKIDQGKSGKDYWGTAIEVAARSFENYAVKKMNDAGYNNGFLAQFTLIEDYKLADTTYPYHLPSEMESIEKAFDDVFSVIEVRKEGGNLAIYEPDSLYSKDERNKSEVRASRSKQDSRTQDMFKDIQSSPDLSPKQKSQSFKDTFNVTTKSEVVREVKVGITQIKSPGDAAHVIAAFRKNAQETMLAIATDGDGNVLEVVRHTVGAKDSSSVFIGELVGAVLNVEGVKKYWLAHNHPSGLVNPSGADYQVTKAIRDLADYAGIDFKGHVIVGEGRSAQFFLNERVSKGVSITAKVRNKTIPITERVISKRGSLSERAITSPQAALEIVNGVSAKEAMILFNTQHIPIGVISLEGVDVSTIRNTETLPRILKGLSTTNTSAVIFKSETKENMSDMKNIMRLMKTVDVRVLDAFVKNEKTGDYDDLSRAGEDLNPRGPFFKLSEDAVVSSIKEMRESLRRNEDDPDSTSNTNKPATESAFSSVDDVKAWVAETEKFLGKKVNVVANKMDLPIAVKFRVGVANFGKDFDAIYDQETGETWINANQIMDKEHAIKTVLHETLGHGGVIDFLNNQEANGGKEVTDALEDIYRRAGRKLINRDIERYGFDYKDKKQRQTAVLEYIAHLAETGKKASWMHKVIGAIKNAMRKIFPNIAWTDLDTLLLLEKGRRHLRENGNDGKGGESLASLAKSSDLVRYEGLQLPRNGSLDQNSSTRVLTKADVVNSSNDALMRLSDSIENDSTLTDKQKAFLDKIGPKSLKQTAVERLSEVMNRWRLKMRQGLVDRFAALLEMDKTILGGNVTSEDNITSSSWVRARMSNGASGAVSAMMSAGRIYLDEGEGVIDVKQDTSGLVHALNKLGGAAEVEKFFGWIAANRAEKLAEEGRENLFTDEDIQAGKVLNQGTLQDGRSRNEVYDQVFTEFQQHRDDILAIAEKAGIITPENREMWANEFYVPFYRVMEDDDSVQGAKTMGGLSRQQAYKKLKGGSQNVNDLLQNTIMNFHHLVDASLKNLAAAQAMDNALELEVATPTNEATKSKQATFVLREGEKVWYDVHDDLVFQSLTALNSTGMNGAAMRTMRWFKRIFTNMTTSTPQFLVANLLRDSLSSMAVADLKFNPVGNVASGIKSFGVLDKSKYERARLLATGGAFSFGHIYGEDADSIRYYIDGEMRRADIVRDPAGLLKHGLKPVQAAWDKWQDVSNSFENANRMAAFKQAEESGKGKLYAAHQSRDMMDFSGIGAWPAVRFLVDVVPFLNARLQGLDKLYRAGVKPTTKVVMNALGVGDVNASLSEKKAAARFMAVVGALSMATMALYLRNKDDEEYQKLEDWHKDSYWWFRVGDNAITIPKPFEVGAIATLTERLLEQAVDDKATGKLFAERLGHMLSSTFAFSPIPQMIQPTIDVYANKDSFTGRQIETMGQQRLSPSMRTTDRTTAAAELLGKGMEAALGADSSYTLSPIQIDYLIGGYFGQVGAWAVGHGDVLRNTLSNNERPARHWYENQPIRRFYKNLGDPHHDKQQSLFYEALRDSSRIYADLQQLRTDKDTEGASELKSENKELLSIRKQLSRTARRLSVINARIKRIKANESIGSDEKRRQIDLLQVRKNALVERTKRLTDSLPR